MPRFLTRNILVWLCALTCFSQAAQASDTLKIAPAYYHIDHGKRLILINQRLTDLLASGQSPRQYLALDQVYAFASPLTSIATNKAYPARQGSTAYTVYFSRIPVVHISARDSIMDTPSVYARFTLTEPGGRTTEAGLGIEYRGGFSQSYPKKSYELSFWADTLGAVSRDVSLLNMRTDNKYNLQALYNEPMRSRSKTANELWQEIHQIYYKAAEPEAKNGISAEYVEVFLNGSYMGIYTLTERIDRKQLKLKKYSNGITGELYKGSGWDGATTFDSLPPFTNASDTWGGFEYKHPEELIDWTRLYSFVDFVENSSSSDFYSTYQQKFHLGNAVDYFILLNLLRAGDNTGKNVYIAKYKQGEPYYFVPWDLDGVFGNDWNGSPIGLSFDVLSNGFYDRLMQDCSATGFRARLRTRWAELRTNVITQEHILARFKANTTYLASNNAYTREQLAWSGFRQDSTQQMTYLADWLRNRLSFLDASFSQQCATVTATTTPRTTTLTLYPNPTSDFLTVEAGVGTVQVLIRDMSGRVVLQTTTTSRQPLDVRHLSKGLYLVTLQTSAAVATKKLLIE